MRIPRAPRLIGAGQDKWNPRSPPPFSRPSAVPSGLRTTHACRARTLLARPPLRPSPLPRRRAFAETFVSMRTAARPEPSSSFRSLTMVAKRPPAPAPTLPRHAWRFCPHATFFSGRSTVAPASHLRSHTTPHVLPSVNPTPRHPFPSTSPPPSPSVPQAIQRAIVKASPGASSRMRTGDCSTREETAPRSSGRTTRRRGCRRNNAKAGTGKGSSCAGKQTGMGGRGRAARRLVDAGSAGGL